MSNLITKSIEIPVDIDGFVSFQCPFCGERFKLTVNFIESDDIYDIWCPYCGLNNELKEFYSDDFKKTANAILENMVIDLINRRFKGINNKSYGNDYFKMSVTGTGQRKVTEPKLIETDDMNENVLKCCDVKVKINTTKKSLYCPRCGVNNE